MGYGGIVNKQQAELLNGIALAYVGDAIFEVFVRDYLLEKGLTKPAFLQKMPQNLCQLKRKQKSSEPWKKSIFLRNMNSHTP